MIYITIFLIKNITNQGVKFCLNNYNKYFSIYLKIDALISFLINRTDKNKN